MFTLNSPPLVVPGPFDNEIISSTCSGYDQLDVGIVKSKNDEKMDTASNSFNFRMRGLPLAVIAVFILIH